ncbi:MAG: AN1-type zinc finger domain-containing protein [Conexivisphaera sp.]
MAGDSYSYYYYYYARPRYRHGEWLHLLVGAALVMAVGLSWFYYVQMSAVGLALDSVLFVLAFVLHEMAHKFSAIRYGYYAEFRLQTWGVVITAISIVVPFFKIIAPGATVIYGPDDRYLMGRTAMWGPATNLVMATLLMAAAYAIPPLYYYLAIAAYINSFIALFNLIPLGILDGLKVFRWNKGLWAAAFAASVVLFVLSLAAVP